MLSEEADGNRACREGYHERNALMLDYRAVEGRGMARVPCSLVMRGAERSEKDGGSLCPGDSAIKPHKAISRSLCVTDSPGSPETLPYRTFRARKRSLWRG
jgi:hypothetical protein